jgi:hypothetical protein
MKTNKINMIINIIGFIIFGLGGYLLISFTTFNRLDLLIIGIISSITGVALCGLQVIETEKK